MDAILRELDRISGAVESHRAADDRATIDALTQEIADLRATVAHLRAGRPTNGAGAPLPARLRPVLARAVLAVKEPATP